MGMGAIAGYAAEKYLAESEVFENQIMDASVPGVVYIWNAVDTASRDLLPVIEDFEKEHGSNIKVTQGRYLQIHRHCQPFGHQCCPKRCIHTKR